MQMLQAQSQKIIGTLKAGKNNAITITPYSVDSTLLQQTTVVQQKALEDLYPPIKSSIPQNNTLKGKKMETGSIVAEKKKPVLFQPVDPSTELPVITDSLPITTTAVTSQNNPIQNTTQAPANNNAATGLNNQVANTNSTVANMYNVPQQTVVNTPTANTPTTQAANNISNTPLYQVPANTTNNSNTTYMVYVNSGGFNTVATAGNSTCSISSFGRITNFNTGNGSPANYNIKGQLESIGNIKINYNYEGRVAAINSVPVAYNFNGNIQQIGNIPIVYTNGKIESIGNSKLYYDANGTTIGADASTNIIFTK
jgi:hypothetical protein